MQARKLESICLHGQFEQLASLSSFTSRDGGNGPADVRGIRSGRDDRDSRRSESCGRDRGRILHGGVTSHMAVVAGGYCGGHGVLDHTQSGLFQSE